MATGLFATSDANPKPVANCFHALFQLTGDPGTNKLTFQPGEMNVDVGGLPPSPAGSPYMGGRWALFQNSVQQYFLMIWDEEEDDANTATTPVTVTLDSHTMSKVEEFNITSGSETAVQTLTNVQSMTVNLDTSLRLLRITYSITNWIEGVSVNNNSTVFSCGATPRYSYSVQRSFDLTHRATLWTTNAPAAGRFSFTDTFNDLGNRAARGLLPFGLESVTC